MIKELKYVLFILTIFFFFFLSTRYYFSNENIKNSYRSITNLDLKIKNYENKLILLESNTEIIIDFVENDSVKKKKKYHFWNLLKYNEQ